MADKKRILTAVFLVLCICQLFFIFKRIHNYPFMIYDMYSRPERKAMRSSHYLVVAGSDTLNLAALPLFEEGRLRNNLRLYEHHLETGADPWSPALSSRQDRIDGLIRKRSDRLLRNSPAALERFPEWLKSHLEDRTGRSIDRLRVSKVTLNRDGGSISNVKLLIDI